MPHSFSTLEEQFLDRHRVAHFASVDDLLQPHVVPVCYVVVNGSLYFSIDEKPKRSPASQLKRIRNIQVNPKVAVVVDHYDEDWRRLGWILMQGAASVLPSGEEHKRAQTALKSRYEQLRDMNIEELPVVCTRIERVVTWGRLANN